MTNVQQGTGNVERGRPSKFPAGHSLDRHSHSTFEVGNSQRVKKFDLDLRLTVLAAAVGRVVNTLPSDRLGSHIAGQLVRCGTAPIAHYAEAQGAESRRDFIH
jgi:hypothetical protein